LGAEILKRYYSVPGALRAPGTYGPD